MTLVDRVRKAAVPVLIAGTIFSTSVLGACDWGNTQPVVNPPASENHVSNNSYDFAKSLGLEADYLIELSFDDNAKDFINYLASMPEQMRNIAEDSGLTEKLIADKQITGNETEYFKKLIGSYQKEIKTMQPWLSQVSEEEATKALAVNLSNFLEADKKGELFYSLKSERPTLLNDGIFYVNASYQQRKYADEIFQPDKWEKGETAINPYAIMAIENITQNFWETHDRAWYVAHHQDAVKEFFLQRFPEEYKDRSPPSTQRGLLSFVRALALETEKNDQSAVEDIALLLEKGSPLVQGWLRLYAWNMAGGAGNKSAPQAKVPLTEADGWSIGIGDLYMIIGPNRHDTITGPITPEDIDLLKSRSSDPLLIFKSPYTGAPTLAVGWTRTSALEPGTTFKYLAGPNKGTPELYNAGSMMQK